MSSTACCPSDECDYAGSITAVAHHIDSRSDPSHSWDALGYDHADEFLYLRRIQRAQLLRETAEAAVNTGKYDRASNLLEDALNQYDEARAAMPQRSATVSQQQEAAGSEREQVTRTKQQNRIEQLLTEAQNHIDSGDAAYADAEWGHATGAYGEALSRTKEAEKLAEGTESELYERAKELSEQAQVRKESLDDSDAHRNLLELIREAKAHREAGDAAFKDSNHGEAVEEYREALTEFKRVSTLLEKFSFGGTHPNDQVCDVCHTEFNRALESVTFDDGTDRQVCPACAPFAPNGRLPTPSDIASQTAVIEEDIESIETGEYGVAWTSSPDETGGGTEDPGANDTTADEQELLIALVGVYQSVEGIPTAADLDEKTEYGYLAYRDQFGSIENALREAGFGA